MNRRLTMMKRILLAPVLALLLVSCGFERPDESAPVERDKVSVPGAGVDRANLELRMGAGEIKIRGGAQDLVDGTLEYRGKDAKPKVTNSNVGSHVSVTIEQPEGARHHSGHDVWDLSLSPKPLLDLTLNCGAGHSDLRLGDLSLRSLEVHSGVGQVEVDLRGQPKRDYDVTINGGVGQAKVYLPHDVGVYAEAHGGIGSIDVTGLEKRGDHYENSAYGKAPVTVRLQVHGGIGQIYLID